MKYFKLKDYVHLPDLTMIGVLTGKSTVHCLVIMNGKLAILDPATITYQAKQGAQANEQQESGEAVARHIAEEAEKNKGKQEGYEASFRGDSE